MKRNKKKNKVMLLLVLLLAVSVGYALIATTLKINGNATITKQTWNVYWGTPTVTEGSVSMTAPTRGADSGDPANTKLTWSVTLDMPGDFYEFTVDAVNAGTIDAMITGITPTVSPALPTNPDYIKYSVTYADGVVPAVNHLLPKADTSTTPSTPTTEKYKVRVYYDENAATRDTINNMSSSTTYTFTLNITYGQADDTAIDIHPKIDSCPGCVYAYYTDLKYYSDYNNEHSPQTRSTLTGYTNNYTDLKVGGVQRKAFLGHILDENDVILKAYACGIKDGTPFCIEGAVADEYSPSTESLQVFNTNTTLLQSANLWNNTCEFITGQYDFDSTNCSTETIAAETLANGDTSVTVLYEYGCTVSYNGSVYCNEYD